MNTHPPLRFTLASPAIRFQAFAVDLLVVVIMTLAAYKTWGYRTEEGVYTIEGFPVLLLFAAIFVYLVFPEIVSGKTLGKQLAGIRVVNADGNEASPGQVIVRHIFDIVDSLPCLFVLYFTLVAATESRQRIGDRVAGTVVIREKH